MADLMPVIEVTFYRVACDHPGCHACDVTGDYSAWEDRDQADEVAMLSGAWLKLGDGPDACYYCSRHTRWCEACDAPHPEADLTPIGVRLWSCKPQ